MRKNRSLLNGRSPTTGASIDTWRVITNDPVLQPIMMKISSSDDEDFESVTSSKGSESRWRYGSPADTFNQDFLLLRPRR